MNQTEKEEDGIVVLVRIRPGANGDEKAVSHDGNSIYLDRKNGKGTAEYSFSDVFGPDSSQEQIYTSCSSLVRGVIEGVNTSIMAYGQTGSGKTYTMLGRGWEDNPTHSVPYVSEQNTSSVSAISTTGSETMSKNTEATSSRNAESTEVASSREEGLQQLSESTTNLTAHNKELPEAYELPATTLHENEIGINDTVTDIEASSAGTNFGLVLNEAEGIIPRRSLSLSLSLVLII